MATLRFPFWVAMIDVPKDQCRRSAYLFTSVDGLIAFLTGHMGRQWHVSVIENCDNLLMAIADLHADGCESVPVDPEPSGESPATISLFEMMQRCHDEAPLEAR